MLLDLLIAFMPTPNLRLQRVLKHGARTTAVIDAIRVDSGENGPVYTWGVRLADGTRAGVRQEVALDDDLRIGSVVPVRVHEGMVVIDDHWHLARPLKRAPEPGVYDQRLPRRRMARSAPGQAILTGAAQVKPSTFQLCLEVEGRSVGLPAERVPSYARHLLARGTALPVALDKQRVLIDWAAAASA